MGENKEYMTHRNLGTDKGPQNPVDETDHIRSLVLLGDLYRLVQGISVHGYELDQYIEKYAKGWKFERIPLVSGDISNHG